jgi:hypothetical protein
MNRLVIERLLEIEDVIPFRFVSHHSKYLETGRETDLKQDKDKDGMGVLVVDTNWTIERPYLSGSKTFHWAREVRDSEVGWTIRFRDSYKSTMPVVADVAHVRISFRTPTSFDRESLWLDVCNYFNIDRFDWHLDMRAPCARSLW